MARVYRPSDRIKIKINEVTVSVSPLTLDQKTEVQQAMITGRFKGDLKEATRGLALAVAYAVKDVSGLENADGSPYQLEHEGDKLTDECVNDLLNTDLAPSLASITASMSAGRILDLSDNNGNPLEGVSVVKDEPSSPN